MYYFELPKELIAQKPASPRDSARLLVYRLLDGSITDVVFRDLDQYLPSDTTLVLNNSKVENCRWLFEGNIEVFVLEKNDPTTIRAMVRPGNKFRKDSKLRINSWLTFETVDIDSEGIRTLRLSVDHDDPRLVEFEHIPLPPYIAQDDSLADEYQTVYARPLGSLAAPTAGLHFTGELLKKIGQKNNIAELTLHVGLGTFAKLTDENIKSGKLHEEYYYIDEPNKSKLKNADHITAVGTTSIRTLESADFNLNLPAGFTDIFIRPGYQFKKVDAVITNFHLPSTSLLMLVTAFLADKLQLDEISAETELMRIYQHAINNKYHFYSFGDAMMIV